MGKTNNHYITLIHKQLSDELTAEERTDLEQWVEAAPENKETRKDLQLIWQESQHYASDIEPDVNVALARFKTRIKTSAVSDEKSAVVHQLPKRRSWLRYAVAACFALLCGLALWFVFDQGMAVKQEIASVDKINFLHKFVDESKVWLNENTNLKYADDFNKNNRTVTLVGEALFDVVKSAGKTFVVETKYTTTTVLGTKFDIKAYPGDDFTEVKVFSGRVKVVGKSGGEVELTAGQFVRYEHRAKSFTPIETLKLKILDWRSKYLNFRHTPFNEVAEILNANFGVNIAFENPAMRSCTFNSVYSEDDVEAILNTIQLVMNWKWKRLSNDEYLLSGDGC